MDSTFDISAAVAAAQHMLMVGFGVGVILVIGFILMHGYLGDRGRAQRW